MLYLKKCIAGAVLVPRYDMDLAWHVHQLHPSLYKKDTELLLGAVSHSEPSLPSPFYLYLACHHHELFFLVKILLGYVELSVVFSLCV